MPQRSDPSRTAIALTHVVAFHGMSDAGVLIGGGASPELKQLVRDAIAAALADAAGPVVIAEFGQALGGSAADNVVNWVTADGDGGVQIEQSHLVRSQHWQAVADAVSAVFSDLFG